MGRVYQVGGNGGGIKVNEGVAVVVSSGYDPACAMHYVPEYEGGMHAKGLIQVCDDRVREKCHFQNVTVPHKERVLEGCGETVRVEKS